MCVLEEYRRQGVGKLLMDRIKGFARDKKINRIELSVWVDNVNAIKLFPINTTTLKRFWRI